MIKALLKYKEEVGENTKCVKTCSDVKPYVDWTTNPTDPFCVASCPEGKTILDGFTDPEVSICTDSCPEHTPKLFHNTNAEGATVCVYPCP